MPKQGPKFYIDIEGKEYEWGREQITVSEIIQLGGLPTDTPIIEIDPDNNEKTLSEDAVIIMKPGHRYGKKTSWKRG